MSRAAPRSTLPLTAAVLLAAVSGYFSVTGMASVYAGGASAAVIVIFVAIEIGKLATAGFLHSNWHRLAVLHRAALAVLVAAAMALTSAGVYGKLTHAFMEQNPARVADEQAQRLAKDEVADLDRQIEALDRNTDAAALVTAAAAKGKVQAAATIAASVRKDRRSDRAELVKARAAAAERLAAAEVKLASRRVELGPAQALAGLAGLKPEDAINAMTLVVTLCLDPLAVLLWMAASGRAEEEAPASAAKPTAKAAAPRRRRAAPKKKAAPRQLPVAPASNDNIIALRRR